MTTPDCPNCENERLFTIYVRRMIEDNAMSSSINGLFYCGVCDGIFELKEREKIKLEE